ncbi:2OG-Fe(II) oxygenase [[Pseudomonas] boreopolis]|uniref:2OG-Fe(II) oxygenase n=1 Tax=Xanthomonas boreopolis TaxID=86183 RepID=UPI003D9FD1D4
MTTSAISRLRHAADSGSIQAAKELAELLIQAGEEAEAFSWRRLAAEAGDADSQLELGRMLAYGIGSVTDPHQARRWFKSAQDNGRKDGAYYLALLALGQEDDQNSLRHLRSAAEAGHRVALRCMAIEMGREHSKEGQAHAMELFRRASELGDIPATLLYAERLFHGEGCRPQQEAARSLWDQLGRHGIHRLSSIMPSEHTAAKVKVLHERPFVATADSLLSLDECRLLIALARPFLRRSRVLAHNASQPIADPVRSSSGATLDPLVEDYSAKRAQHRAASAFGLRLENAEWLSVLHYLPGEEYRPHRDYLPPQALEAHAPQSGNREHTLCLYLNDVEEGGETAFLCADMKVSPKAGRAVCFSNMSGGRPDPDSLHAGLPVSKGEKWLATLWVREHSYRPW